MRQSGQGAAEAHRPDPSRRGGRGLAAAGRVLGLCLVAAAVANCAGPQVTRKRASTKDYGVPASPRVIPEGQPIPKGGGREMVGKPYVVGGQTYVPHGGRGYDREGVSSWYGSAFHGRLTANGEVFDREAMAAAHPTLPLPSYVRVTNLTNGRSMIVRVNDRGPYEKGRLIDVSEAVAGALQFARRGVTRVRVTYMGKASLNGSDDKKLLASLRTDGEPATLGRSAPVMVAEARPAAPVRAAERRPEEPVRVKTAERMPAAPEAAPARTAGTDAPPAVLPPVRERPPARLSVLAAADEAAAEDAAEPEEGGPTFAGIY